MAVILCSLHTQEIASNPGGYSIFREVCSERSSWKGFLESFLGGSENEQKGIEESLGAGRLRNNWQ